MDQGERTGRAGDRREPAARPFGDESEEERDHGRHEQLTARRRGQRQRRERPAAAGGEREDPDRRREHREPAPGRTEDLLARLPRDDERDRHEHARLVLNDRRRVDPGEPGDEGEEAVPERECVPGVQPAVTELVDGAERERPEVVELPDAGEVEEVVPTGQMPHQEPERDPEADAGGNDCERDGGQASGLSRPHHGGDSGTHRDRGEQDQRPRQRGVDEEHHGGRDEKRAEAPGERSREAGHAQRSRDQEPGHEQTGRRRGEPQTEPPAGLRSEPREPQRRQREQRHERPRDATHISRSGAGKAGTSALWAASVKPTASGSAQPRGTSVHARPGRSPRGR